MAELTGRLRNGGEAWEYSHNVRVVPEEYAHQAVDLIEAQKARIQELEEALWKFLEEYVDMVKSGDCGFWDPEGEEKVIAARNILGSRK